LTKFPANDVIFGSVVAGDVDAVDVAPWLCAAEPSAFEIVDEEALDPLPVK
jgi:hypothetical protein